MKKFLAMTLIVTMLTLIIPIRANASSNASFIVGIKTYFIEGYAYQMDVAPFLEKGRVFVPVRYLAYMLDIKEQNIIWDNSSQTLFLGKEGGGGINLYIGSNIMQRSNNTPVYMDAAPLIRQDRIFLPARYIAEEFGYTVTWQKSSQTVVINNTKQAPIIYNPPQPSYTEDDTLIPAYTWAYEGETWTWEPAIKQNTADSVIEYYRSKQHPHRNELDYILTYCTDKESLKILETLAQIIENSAKEEGISDKEIPYFAIAFLQSFPYVSDSVSSGYDEYPRYPLETLLERKGDCEDTAILTAVLLRQLGYGTSLIFLPQHCAVGIKGAKDLPGVYYEVNGIRYYYLETTASGWTVGTVPEEYKGHDAVVLPLP